MAEHNSMDTGGLVEPGLVEPGEGDSVTLGGVGVIYKVTGRETGGAFAIVEHPLQPGALAAPPHTHTREDELSFVLEGEVGVQIGEEVYSAGPGTYIRKPRGVPHTFWNATDRPARLLEIISPAGFENYFREAAAVLAASSPPDIGKLIEAAARYGLTFHMERLPAVMAAHRVSL
jgi:quercetin dioxygenase-like cupin family protein